MKKERESKAMVMRESILQRERVIFLVVQFSEKSNNGGKGMPYRTELNVEGIVEANEYVWYR